MTFTERDPHFQERVRESFAAQSVMRTLGASLDRVEPGEVDIALSFRDDLTQQDGFLHACGYAAHSLMERDANVLSIEFKLNLLAPALGERVVARARVLRAGRTITVCRADVVAIHGGAEKLVATMLGTMMTVRGQSSRNG